MIFGTPARQMTANPQRGWPIPYRAVRASVLMIDTVPVMWFSIARRAAAWSRSRSARMMSSWSSWRAGTADASGCGTPLVLISRSDMSHILRLIPATTAEWAMSWMMPWKRRFRTR